MTSSRAQRGYMSRGVNPEQLVTYSSVIDVRYTTDIIGAWMKRTLESIVGVFLANANYMWAILDEQGRSNLRSCTLSCQSSTKSQTVNGESLCQSKHVTPRNCISRLIPQHSVACGKMPNKKNIVASSTWS